MILFATTSDSITRRTDTTPTRLPRPGCLTSMLVVGIMANGSCDRTGSKPDNTPKAEFLTVANRLQNSENSFFGLGQIETLKRRLAERGLSPQRLVELHGKLSKQLLRTGDLDGAIEHIETTLKEARGDQRLQPLMPMILRVRGSIYLRQAELDKGVAAGDYDNGGDQDVYAQLGGMLAGDKFCNALFQNAGHGNHFIIIKLVGTESDRIGYGARIKSVLNTPAGEREIHRAVGSGSSFGGSPSRQEIGIGREESVLHLEVWWPKSDTPQVFTNVPIDCMIRITEGKTRFDRREFKTIRFPL